VRAAFAVCVAASFASGAAGAAGCTRDAAAPICPEVAVGELVISEIQ
jgi:hypothetical protein